MSIYKVAEVAGVSVGSVSRVINGRCGVSRKVEGKVRKAMVEIGYVPKPKEHRPGPKINQRDVLGSQNKQGFISVIPIGVSFKSIIQAPVYSRLFQGIETELKKNGYSMSLNWVEQHELSDFIKNKDLRGIILFLGDENLIDEELILSLKSCPTVSVFGSNDFNLWCDHITVNESKVDELAAKYLAVKGHTNVAYIGVGTSRHRRTSREMCFKIAAEELGAKVSLFIEDNLTYAGQYIPSVNVEVLEHTLALMLELKPRPTGLFLHSDMFDMATYAILRKMGINPGKDIDIISVNNDTSLLVGLTPRPAVIDLKVDIMGQVAVQRLLWRIENHASYRTSIIVDPELIIDET